MAYNFDVNLAPEAVRPVVVLAGSYYDMGVQYGQQAKEIIARNAAVAKPQITGKWRDWEKVVEIMDIYEEFIQKEAPELLEMWRGMADGAGLEYDDVRIINLSLQLLVTPLSDTEFGKQLNACSHMSVWGNATKDGKLITGANLDQDWNSGGFSVVVVAFPDDGNNFITTPAWGGEINGNFGLNDKGVVTLGSGGQMYAPEDTTIGYSNFHAKLAGLLHCSTSAEAAQKYIDLKCGGAENAEFADPSGSMVVEYTPAHHVVRKSGDFGEKDYIVATNHYIAEEMKSSLFPSTVYGGYYGSAPRYNTYCKLIEDHYGDITLDVVKDIMSTHDYWDGELWHKDVYSRLPEEDLASRWTIEMRSVDCKTLMRGIAIPEDRVVYLMNGQTDCRMSNVPDSLGEFCKLTLLDDIQSVVNDATDEAKVQLWLGAERLNKRAVVDAERDKMFNDAKKEMWKGYNYVALAGNAESKNEELGYYGKALTAFCKAQTYAIKASK